MDLNDAEIIKLTGPALLLGLLNWGLFGVLSVQVYLYSQAFPNDRHPLKVMVYGVYILEIIQTALLTETAWNLLAKGFGHVEALNNVGTIWLSVCLIGGAIALVAQIFYAYRIWIISENNFVPTFIVLMSIVSFTAAAVVSAITKQAKFFSSAQVHALRTSTFIGIWAGAGSACDIVIAACMCFYLSKRIRGGCFPKTRALISKVKVLTIETGALTASVSVVTLALYYAPKIGGFQYYGVPMSVVAKLYSNTALAVLNSRMRLSIMSESTTWQHNELPLTPLSAIPQKSVGCKVLQFASPHTTDSDIERTGGIEQKAHVISTPKTERITFSEAIRDGQRSI